MWCIFFLSIKRRLNTGSSHTRTFAFYKQIAVCFFLRFPLRIHICYFSSSSFDRLSVRLWLVLFWVRFSSSSPRTYLSSSSISSILPLRLSVSSSLVFLTGASLYCSCILLCCWAPAYWPMCTYFQTFPSLPSLSPSQSNPSWVNYPLGFHLFSRSLVSHTLLTILNTCPANLQQVLPSLISPEIVLVF